MPITLPTIDLTTLAITGQQQKLDLSKYNIPANQEAKSWRLQLYNESGVGLKLTFSDNGLPSYYVVAGGQPEIIIPPGESGILIDRVYSLNNADVQQLLPILLQPNEPTISMGPLGNSPTSVNSGGGVATQVINDNNPTPLTVMESTPLGGSSVFTFKNDGTGFFGGGFLSFDAAGHFFQTVAGDSASIYPNLLTRSTLNVFNVQHYMQDLGQSFDTAFQSAQTDANAVGGGYVYLPAAVYVPTTSMVINFDFIHVIGDGFATIIRPANTGNFDVISTPIPGAAGNNGFVRNYISIENLYIDQSNQPGTVAGQGNGIHTYGMRYSLISNVFVNKSPNWALLLDGDNAAPGHNFGFDNRVTQCIFDLTQGGNIYQTNCEANRIDNNQFKYCNGVTTSQQPTFPGTDTVGMHLRLSSGYAYVAGNVFGKGGTSTNPAVRCENSGPCRIIGNRFDQVRYQAIVLNGGNHMFAFNQLGTPSEIGNVNAIQIGSNGNVVIGNVFDNTAGAYNHLWALAESGGPFNNNVYLGNKFAPGTSGTLLTTSGSLFVNEGNYGVHETLKGDAVIGNITTTYQMLDTDNLVFVDTTGGAFTVTLPNPRRGYFIEIKDFGGHCGTNNITINTLAGALMDNQASGTVKITTNFGNIAMVSDSTNWWIQYRS